MAKDRSGVSVLLSGQGLSPHPLTAELHLFHSRSPGMPELGENPGNQITESPGWMEPLVSSFLWVCWFHPTYYATKIINRNIIFAFYKSFKIPVPYLTLTTNSWSHYPHSADKETLPKGLCPMGLAKASTFTFLSLLCLCFLIYKLQVMPTAADKRVKLQSKFLTLLGKCSLPF